MNILPDGFMARTWGSAALNPYKDLSRAGWFQKIRGARGVPDASLKKTDDLPNMAIECLRDLVLGNRANDLLYNLAILEN